MRKDGGPAAEYQTPDSGPGECDGGNESGRAGADHNDGPAVTLIRVPEIQGAGHDKVPRSISLDKLFSIDNMYFTSRIVKLNMEDWLA